MRVAAGSDVLDVLKKRFAGQGTRFDLYLPDGRSHAFGDQPDDPPAFQVWLRNERGVRALRSLDEVPIGLAFLDGDIDLEGDLLAAFDLRDSLSDWHPVASAARFLRPLLAGQIKSDKHWIPQHYDYGDELYFAFLDKKHRVYSQAVYTADDEPLEQAAENKLAYAVEACRLGPGSHVLDVGAGWGAFARYAAGRGIDVTMLTISPAQLAFLSELSTSAALPGRLRAVYHDIFDYSPGERYDAVVLPGAMEHLPDYRRLFRKFEELVHPNGWVYMDFSAVRTKFKVSTFTYRYVFPGNGSPVVLPDLLAAANRTSFEPIALHNDRHSYYLTLRDWARNLEAARAELVERFGERTVRLFRLYLWATAHQLHRDGGLESYRVVFQRSHGRSSAEIGASSRSLVAVHAAQP
jgi:cyclopropane-fatty-acyl-phospholipid synthase